MTTDPTSTPSASGSIQDRIRLAVEAEIVSGERPPGSAIDDRQLAERFQASRTPVREALLVLAAQGLVHIAPRAGIYVRRASVNELVATLEAVMEVESVLASLAARRASPAQCEVLRVALAAASARAEADDRRGYDVANVALHAALYQASGNPVLVETVLNLRRTLAAYRQRSTSHPGRLKASDAEHRRIIAAICAGDPVAAATEMRQHINLGGEAMVQLVLAAQSLGGPPDGIPLPPAATIATPRRTTASAKRTR